MANASANGLFCGYNLHRYVLHQTMMFGLLPLVAFLLFAAISSRQGWRAACLYAALICGLIVAASKELLSLFHAINFATIAGVWVLAILVSFAYLTWNWESLRPSFDLSFFTALSIDSWLLIASILFIAATTAVAAWYAAPNTWDSMTYHLARIIHWMQNGSVEFYPTPILRQLHQNPWSEYAMMDLLILSHGGDRLVNFIQWLCMLGSLVGLMLIAEQLGANIRGQILSATLAATIPMGILQASSTQNDYAVAFWLVCFVFFGIEFKKSSKTKHAIAMGAALGLAILTKATAYIYAIPFLMWFGLSILSKARLAAFRPLFIAAAVVIALNLGHYARNYELYGNPIGPGQESETGNDYSNDIFTIPALASNLMRNFAVHLGTPYYNINVELDQFFYRAHEWIGISPNDPRTTWTGTEFHVGYLSFYDGKAGSPIHIWLIIFVIPVFLTQKRAKGDEAQYLLALLLGFLIFCLYLKWQSWHSRLHLPLFVLWSAWIGRILDQARIRGLIFIGMIALVATSMLWIFRNESHPVLGADTIFNTPRDQQYFTRNKSLFRPFQETTDFLARNQCASVGLMTDWDGWEYPLWMMLKQFQPDAYIMQVNVDNVSKVYHDKPPFDSFEPCAVVVINPASPDEVAVGKTTFVMKQSEGIVSVYLKQP